MEEPGCDIRFLENVKPSGGSSGSSGGGTGVIVSTICEDDEDAEYPEVTESIIIETGTESNGGGIPIEEECGGMELDVMTA
jgi:hypothetical protein